MNTRWSIAGFVLAVAVGSAWAEPFASQSTPPLFTPIGDGPVANFTLTDQFGDKFEPSRLRGKVWIVHFFFTTCLECNQTSIARVKEIQNAIKGKADLALVSISLNPDGDTPETLATWANDVGAVKGQQWYVLRGRQPELLKIVQEIFHVSAQPNANPTPGKEVEHDQKLLIVDRDGKIAGYFDAKETNVAPLIERIRGLASERYVLPAVNAMLNALAGFLLVIGYLAIRRKQIALHKGVMLAAFACSAIFLGCYLYYHFAVLDAKPTALVAPPAVRIAYLTILLTHTVLAAVVAPLAIYVVYRGLTNDLARHVKVARWTLPIWLYVSATGVVVYVVLYHLYPPY